MGNLENKYLYRGLLNKDGTYDRSVYKDDNALKLVQNYAAGYIRSGEKLFDQGSVDDAIRAAEKAVSLSKSVSILYTAGALFYRCERMDLSEKIFRQLVADGYGEFPIMRLLGRTVERQGRLEEAEQIYMDAYSRYPDDQEALREVYSFYFEQDRPLDAYKVLDTWVTRHPADEAARKRLIALGDTLKVKGS
jgi:tetratricopeptide (TPR) repeat protein